MFDVRRAIFGAYEIRSALQTAHDWGRSLTATLMNPRATVFAHKKPRVMSAGLERQIMSLTQTLDFNSSYGKASRSSRSLSLVDRFLARGKTERFVEIMRVTPAIADEMLKCNSHNRPIVGNAVDAYSSMMTDDLWKLTIEAVGFDRAGILQNGQHRLLAIIDSGVTVPMTVWFGIESDEFEVIDQGRKRTAAHLVALNGFDNSKNRAALALCIICLEDQPASVVPAVTINARVADMSSNPNGHFNMAVLIIMRLRKVTSPSSSGLAAYTILQAGADLKKVEKLFSEIASGEGLHDVRYRLREWLRSSPVSTANNKILTIKRAAAIIHGWNAIQKGNKTAKFDWPHVTQLPAVRT